MKKYLLAALIGSAMSPGIQAQLTLTENYVSTKVCLDSACVKKSWSVQYLDGLGRPKQIVNVGASPAGKDIVTHVEYDGFGRQVRDYLPVPQSGTQNGQIYTSPLFNAPAAYGAEKIYSEKILENSPLDRIQQQIQAGNAWSGKPVSFSYGTNTASEVKRFTTATTWVDSATSSVLATPGNYGANQLYKNTVTDEDGSMSIEFRNGEGQTVLVRKNDGTNDSDTYYVYNEYNQLAFVIPPLAVAAPTVDQAVLDGLCYQYRYDGRNRLVEKKLPGKGWEYMVYDKQDRLVMTQDANRRNEGSKWLFTKYDQFGRVVLTGITLNSTQSRQQKQDDANNAGANNTFRTKSTTISYSGLGIDYDVTQTFPPYADISQLLSVNYYDTYPSDMPAVSTMGFTQTFLSDNSQNSNVSTKSLPTASYIKNIEDNDWTKNYSFYDLKGRATASYTKNHLGGYTKTESILDFSGVPKKTYTHHNRTNSTAPQVKIEQTFTYDHQNRLVKHEHQVNNQAPEILAENTYNEIGLLLAKKVGNNIQEINYKYNIRGWLTAVNNPDNIATMGTDLFGYRIRYNEPIQGLQNPNADFPQLTVKPRYNGNIAEVDWNTVHYVGSPPRPAPYRFGYVYDGLNRMKAGFFQDPNNPSQGKYHEIIDEYDFNGNIVKLKRFGGVNKSGNPIMIDDLVFTYAGNRATNINDQSGNAGGYEGGNGNIGYDTNGNMTSMPDKGITNIGYNHLNLPAVIIQQNITNYLYRSDGVKLKKSYTINNDLGTNTLNTEYLDGFHYVTMSGDIAQQLREPDDNTVNARTATEEEVFILPEEELIPVNPGTVMALSFFPTAEGFYDYRKKQYIYQYKDHLGNVRLSYGRNTTTNKIEILDRNDYYPFGMNFLAAGGGSVYNPQGSPFNYKYQGQELQETGFYSFKWRNYMPDVGRFFNIDPLAESFPYNSTYAFAENRVIDGRELEGLEWVSTKNDQGVTTNRQLTVSIANSSTKLNDKQFNKLVESIKTDFSKTYGADGATATLIVSDKATIKANVVDQKGTVITDADGNEVGTAFKGGVTDVLGESQKNGFTITASNDGEKRGTSDITRSFNHEAGHTAGLDHPWKNRDKVSDINQNSKDVTPKTIKSNLLNSGENPNPAYQQSAGSSLTPGQFKKMDEVIQSQQPKN